MAYGLTPAGFVAKTMEILVEERIARCRTEFGFVPRGFLKKLIEIVCEAFTELWELGELTATGMDPDAATNTLQEAVAAITGTLKLAAEPSTVTLTLTGTPATLVPAESQAKVTATNDTFETLADGTITLLTSWVTLAPYVVGNRRTNASRVYVCITSGTSGATGPIDTLEDETDGTVHWRYVGEGTGAVDVEAECTETGPIEAPSGEINAIVTPVSGWSSVINLLDADLGRNVETGEELRIRREQELSQAGATTPDAIRAELLDVAGVVSATVFYNPSDVTDGDGVPPHSVECLIRGGVDQDIYDLLLAKCIAAGIGTHGTSTGSAVDSEGTSHTVKFSRPDEIEIYVIVDLIKDPAEWPSDGVTQTQNAIVTYGDAQKSGKDAVAWSIGRQAGDVAGVLDVTSVKIGTAPAPTLSTTIAITTRQLAVFDTSRITVNTTNGTP